jgi:hypothetical protein
VFRLVRQQRRPIARKVGAIGPRVQPGWNIVANAAIRTGTMKKVICRTNSGSLRMSGGVPTPARDLRSSPTR